VPALAKPANPVYVITPVVPKKAPAKTSVDPIPSVPAAPPAPLQPPVAPVAEITAAPIAPAIQAKSFPSLPEKTETPAASPPATYPRLPLLVPRWVKIAGLFVAAGVLYSCLSLPWHLAAVVDYARGQQAEDRKDYSAAASYYQASLKQCPHSPVVLGRLGVVSVYQGDQHTLDWVNGELSQPGTADADGDSDATKARDAINEALKSGKHR
jgi:hypothetical protein